MNTRSIVSIGKACSIIQAMPTAVRAAAAELRINPELIINGVPHYAEDDVERIGQHVHRSAVGCNRASRGGNRD